MELGLQLANQTWSGGAAAMAQTIVRVATTAEEAGIARLAVMDHVWQIPHVGETTDPMLEAYTTLGFLAAHTRRVQLHTMVTSVLYRAPGLLAKQISTLDVLSGGRAGLGIGAGWHGDEAQGLGLPFAPTAERFERLEEALQICLQMWSGSDAPYHGTHYHLERTLNVPQPLRERPYLLIGGSGERRTLRLVAQYADACNLHFYPDAPHKLEVLRRHCEAVGRDDASIEKTTLSWFFPGTTRDDLLRRVEEMRAMGFSVAYFSYLGPDPLEGAELVGSLVAEVAAG